MNIGKENNGLASFQYMALLVFVISAFILMTIYINRGLWGQWKATGDAFGFGRQIKPGSRLCAYAQIRHDYGVWYDDNCYHHHWSHCPPGDQACEDGAKITCAKNYCCEDNTQPPGTTNCP